MIIKDGKWTVAASIMGSRPSVTENVLLFTARKPNEMEEDGAWFAAGLRLNKRWELMEGRKISTYVSLTLPEADAVGKEGESGDKDDSDVDGYVEPSRTVKTEYTS
jgi:hypothetical protein